MNVQTQRRERSIYRNDAAQQAIRDWCTHHLDQWSAPHQRRVLPTCAGSTHVVMAGSGSPTVVLVPGTNANAATYESFATALASTWRTLILDLPGQPGLSAAHRPRGNRLAWYGRWLRDVLAQTGTDDAIVVGHSLGGAIALACDSPRIAGRVLISPGGLARLKITAPTIRATLPWLLRPTSARSTALLRLFLTPGHLPPAPLVEWYTLLAQSCRTSLAPPVLPHRLLAQRAAVPCLVVTGEHDAFLPPRRLAQPASRLLATELQVIPDAGHLVTDEQPDALLPLIEEVIAGPPAPRGPARRHRRGHGACSPPACAEG